MPFYTESYDGLDLSAGVDVLTYTLAGGGPRQFVCRVRLGSEAKPVAASGAYGVRVWLNDVNLAPNSDVLVEAGPAVILQSREITLEAGDTLRMNVTGRDTDVDVPSFSSLIDQSPVTVGDLHGSGEISVDHNYGGVDALAYKLANGSGVDNATIQAFLKSDYDAGRRSANYIRGTAETNVRGRWVAPMQLDPDTYVLLAYRQGTYGPNTRTIVVS